MLKIFYRSLKNVKKTGKKDYYFDEYVKFYNILKNILNTLKES